MLKVFLAFMFGGTGIVQLLDKRYKAFMSFVYCWLGNVISVIVAIYILAYAQPNWEDGIDLPTPAGIAFMVCLLVLIACNIRLVVLHVQTIIQTLLDYSSEVKQKK